MIPSGTCSRLAIGLIVLVPVTIYNETGAITVLFSVFIATICAIFSGKSMKEKFFSLKRLTKV